MTTFDLDLECDECGCLITGKDAKDIVVHEYGTVVTKAYRFYHWACWQAVLSHADYIASKKD